MIKAIIFDFYGVVSSDELWDFVGADKQAESTISQLADRVNLGHLSWDEFCKELAAASTRSVAEIEAMYSRHRINRPLILLIKSLKAKYRIGLLTNANRSHIDDILNSAGIDILFDSMVVSADLGKIKPDPEIYQESLHELTVKPEEAVFVDDIQRNVEGAKAVGMQAIWYQSFEDFSNKLKVLLGE